MDKPTNMADRLSSRMTAELLRKALDFVGEDDWVVRTVCRALRSCDVAEPACRCSKCGAPRKEYIVTERCDHHRRDSPGSPCLDCHSRGEYGDCRHLFAAPPTSAVSSIERYQWTTEWLGWPQKMTLPAAAALGRVDVFELAFDPLPAVAVRDSVLVLAAMHGHIDIIKSALARGCEWHFDVAVAVCGAAAQSGYVDVIELAFPAAAATTPHQIMRLLASISGGAGSGCKISILEWARDHDLLNGQAAATAAARANQYSVIEWVMTEMKNRECTDEMYEDYDICAAAAGGGHLELLRRLRDLGFMWTSKTCSAAARAGHLDVLQFARAQDCRWRYEVLSEAAACRNNVAMLEWMCENECELNPEACTTAAYNGQLGNLQYLRSVGVDWDDKVCEVAAIRGHLQVLRWAYDNGCPWTFRDAALLLDDYILTPEIRDWIRNLRKRKCNK